MLQATANTVLAELAELEEEESSSENNAQSRSNLAERLASRVPVRFKPGLLFFPGDGMRGMLENSAMKQDAKVANAVDAMKIASGDKASMLGLSVSALRDLGLSSGSWVCISLTLGSTFKDNHLRIEGISNYNSSRHGESGDLSVDLVMSIIRIRPFLVVVH